MKKLIGLATLLLAIATMQMEAQTPQGMNYQAIARDPSGAILVYQHIALRLTITNGNGGPTLYQETDTTTTNLFGLFALNLGNGVTIGSPFSTINWGSVTPWLSVEIDPTGGTTYNYMGSSQLLSVPYALFAASGNQGPPGLDGDRYTTTSTSTMTIAMITQNFNVAIGLNYSVGQTIIIANSLSNMMTATVASYNPVNGAMSANVTSITGGGSYSFWNVSLNGAPGPAGPPGIIANGTATGNTTYWNGTTWVVNSSNFYNNGGNIGINTNTPSTKLHIRGSADTTELTIDANPSQSSAHPMIRLRNSSGLDLLHIHSDDVSNTFVGLNAGHSDNGGTFNTFIGSGSGYTNTNGSDNTALGTSALYSNSTGSDNTSLGYLTLNSNVNGNNNTAAGSLALTANVGGNDNVAFGVNALATNTFGYSNCAVGSASLYANTLGIQNTSVGFQALYTNIQGNGNVAVGSDALYYNANGSDNTVVGKTAMNLNNSGNNNSALGSSALYSNISGKNNVAIGKNAMFANNSGYSNSAIGVSALYANNLGFSNTASGDSALLVNTGGYENTATGKGALQHNINGDENTASGVNALFSNTTGGWNTAHGDSALFTNTIGQFNTALGFHADASDNALFNATAIGANAIVDDSNKVRIGDANVTVIEGAVDFSFPSDARFKFNVSDEVKGLDFIKLLRPVVYNFDTKKYEDFVTKNLSSDIRRKHLDKDFSKSTSIRQSGFIAQEVEAAMKKSGYNFNGLKTPKTDAGHYAVSYSLFVVPLVKAVQEQQEQIEELKKENELLRGENASMKSDIGKIKAQLGMGRRPKNKTGITGITRIYGIAEIELSKRITWIFGIRKFFVNKFLHYNNYYSKSL